MKPTAFDGPHARHMCCGEHGVFVELQDGSMFWRRHEWPGDKWQPIIPPSVGFETAKPKPVRRSRRR